MCFLVLTKSGEGKSRRTKIYPLGGKSATTLELFGADMSAKFAAGWEDENRNLVARESATAGIKTR